MKRPKVLSPDESYTFAKYFELAYDIEDILADLDCSFERTLLSLPRTDREIPDLNDLRQQVMDGIQYVSMTSEQARREFLIAPIIRQICRQTQKRVRVEYPIAVNNWLKGTLDYYFQDLLVIEAKRDNLNNGFTQLAVALIALDQWINSDTPILYGAVTTGNDWYFGQFHRQQRQISQDLKLYRVPEELDILIGILIGLLS
ncbi:MAG TPA: hypothetical protein DDZ80_27005 [Cyanobacteria bacterium UBA8803]|nr:hypothetical protein [Cyanobacteria bacterium UBA9273]HBL61926.1 hypothetical protein [Cyanobacteria bacterium UBA8803]